MISASFKARNPHFTTSASPRRRESTTWLGSVRRNFPEISDKGSRLISRDPHKRYALRRPVTLDARTTQEIRPRKGRDGRKKRGKKKRRKKEERRRGRGGKLRYAYTDACSHRVCAGETMDQREPGSEEMNSERGETEPRGQREYRCWQERKKKRARGETMPGERILERPIPRSRVDTRVCVREAREMKRERTDI